MSIYSHQYPLSYCKNPEAFTPPLSIEPVIRPHSELLERLGQLAAAEQDIIMTAVTEAVELRCDIHLYRSSLSPYLGLAFIPGTGPTVKVWEHQTALVIIRGKPVRLQQGIKNKLFLPQKPHLCQSLYRQALLSSSTMQLETISYLLNSAQNIERLLTRIADLQYAEFEER